MCTVFYPCGCSISCSMYGNREILAIFHCRDHHWLYSQNKTILDMANEIRGVQDDQNEISG